MMSVKSILSFQQKLPHTSPHVIKSVMDYVFEIEPVVSFLLFHGFLIIADGIPNVHFSTKK